MRGLVALVLLSASIAFSHVVIVGAVLALLTGVALVWAARRYRQS